MKRSILITLSAALGAAFLLTASAVAQYYVSTEDNTNRRGGDYRNFDLSVPDPALCREACSSDSQCLAYTYAKPGVSGPNARCWLKNPVPASTAENCCVSGVKSGSTGAVPVGEFEHGVSRSGGDYRSFDIAADPAQCRSACAGESQCAAYTYVKPNVQGPNARCWLKSSVPAIVRNECCVSGVKGGGALSSGSMQASSLGSGSVRITWVGKPGGAQDWITVVRAGTPIGDPGPWRGAPSPSGATDYTGLPPGEYEARFFLNNSYTLQEQIRFNVY